MNILVPRFEKYLFGWNIVLFNYLGTLFLELWKRKTASLAYEWDVDEFEETEPDRPEFYGTKQRIVS